MSSPIPPPDLRPKGPSAKLNPPLADKSGGGTIYLFAATRWEVSPELYQLPNVSVIITGIGVDNAYRVGAGLKPAPTKSPLLLSIGLSGSTHESLRPYDIVLANVTHQITHSNEWRTENEFRFPEGNLSSYHDTPFEQSRVVWGHIGSVPRPIWFPGAKKEIGSSRAVCAIDMESCAVARAAQEHHLPFLAIRIILDSIDEPLIGWRPWEFVRRVFKARNILGRFIEHYFKSTDHSP